MRLYSYCIPIDDGAAPNPYWNTCSLVICKPKIRRTASEGDWIVGTGSKCARLGDGTVRDYSGRLVYAMKIAEKMTMREYDDFTRRYLPEKVPVWTSFDRRMRLGDSIYDFSGSAVIQRDSVHDPANQPTDLSGEFALLSKHFFYFGKNAIELPSGLRAIAQNQQGHRVTINEPYVALFVEWAEALPYKPGILGEPLLDLFQSEGNRRQCAAGRCEADIRDREVLEDGCP